MRYRPLSFILSIFFLIAFGCPAIASEFSPELRTYRITCDQDQLTNLITYSWRNDPIPCVYADDSGAVISGEIRLRGESSRGYPKKSFKIDFPVTARYGTRDKINLNSAWTDASFVREYLSYDLFRRAGLPAPKCRFVKLFINEVYYGLYLDVEQVDKIFLSDRGLDDSAPLFKAAENGSMLTHGEIEAGLWERETGDETDFTELRNLIDWLSDVPDGSFYDGLNIRFDVDKLSRIIAVNALIGNSSTYYHNYYLVRFRGEAGRWEYIPWDTDQSFYYHYSRTSPSYYRSGHQTIGTNELIRRCWLDDRMRLRIVSQISNLTDSLFTYDYYRMATDSLAILLQDAVIEDTAKQFGDNDFILSLELIPADVRGRGVQITALSQVQPRPFDLFPAVVTPSGVVFQWSSAADTGDGVTYNLEVSTDIDFPAPEWIAADVNALHYRMPNLPAGEYFWRVIAYNYGENRTTSLHQFSKFRVNQFDFNAIDAPYLISGTQRIRPGQGIYRASRNIVIEPDGILQIERGVRVLFADSAGLIVKGRLEVVDAAGDSVEFEPLDPTKGWKGILIENGGSANFMGAAISGIKEDGVSAAIMLEAGADLTMSHSSIAGSNSPGIFASDASVKIERCRISAETGGIRIERGRSTLIEDSEFLGGNENSAIQLEVSEHTGPLLVERTRFSFGYRGIANSGVDESFISRCWFEEFTGAAISIENSISLISNSIFIRCETGVMIENSSVEIWNSDFIKSTSGIFCDTAIPAKIRNSVIYQSTGFPIDNPNGSADVSFCLSDKPLPGIGNILGAPQFEKPWDGNFTPESGSPLIDAGLSDGAPATDYYGTPRLNTDGQKNWGVGRYKYYDIGAVEYPIGASTPAAMHGEKLFVYPNPLNDRAEVIFEIEVDGKANLAIFDIIGRMIGERRLGNIAAGQYRMDIDSFKGGAELTTGLYFCRLEQTSGTFVTRMVVIR